MARNAMAFMIDHDDGRRYEAGACRFVYRDGVEGPVGIIHGCPCGCGSASAMFFKGRGAGRPEWDVEGEWPKVTLSPSIGIRKDSSGAFHWHGYLRAGVFEEL